MEPFEAMDPLVGTCDNGSTIAEVAAVDAYTVQFTSCTPDPAFLSKIAFSVFGIYPREWLESTTAPGARLDRPIGTGPYVVGDWVRGESLTYQANPDYWGDAAEAETLVFRWGTESAARLLELQAGTVDGINYVAPTDFETVEGDANLQLQIRPALNVFYIGMNNTYPPFDNVKVRQAVAMGIDRQRIVDTFYPAGSEAASHFTPCTIPNGCVGDSWYDFDAEAARALLAEAGFPDGFATKLYYRDVVRGYLPQVAQVATEIQAQLKDNLNIDATIEVQESGTFIANANEGALDGFHLLGWTGDYPHITNFLDFHFAGTKQQFGDPFPEIYETLAEAAQIADPADAESLYVTANNNIRELVPMVPVAHGGSAAAYKADVTNPQASPLGDELFYVMDPGGRDTLVWMQAAEPISLFCQDETDGESLSACEQTIEALYGFEINGTAVHPVLAESCEANEDLTVWTCILRQGVKFHDGSDFDANDVVATFSAGLDLNSPLHVGNTGAFEYWITLWGNLIGAPPPG
jgi:ABC-type transport system substrate-binding protein